MKNKSRKFLVAWIGSIVITGCGVTQSLDEGSRRDTTNWVKRLHLEHDSEFDWIIVDQGEKLYRDGKASVFE